MGNRELLENLGINLIDIKMSGKTHCPKCGTLPNRLKKEDLSVNISLGKYNCHNPDCDFSGGVKSEEKYMPKDKEYVRPEFNNRTTLSDETVKYFQGRCIHQDTLIKAKVTEGVVWMPRVDKVNTIQFNYFRNGQLINTKFRAKDRNFRLVKDAELILYNYDNAKDSDWCVIVEGEPDCLSFMQVGIDPVMSVPNGASMSGSPNLEYLDNCIEIFENKKKIILATDNDQPGILLREELARRLGYDRCYKVDLQGCKDANEFLKSHTEQELRDIIDEKNLIEFPMSGIVSVKDIWEDVESLLENGLSRGEVTGVLADFDDNVSFVLGQLMIITGIPNHGKSPFALQIMCAMSVKNGWKWALFTPEHHPLSVFIVTICECLLGKRVRKGTITQRERELVRDFIDDHFYFIIPEDDNCSVSNIVNKAKQLVLRKGIRGLLIDPWNKVEHNMEKGESETTYVSRALDEIINFDQKNNVFSIIIAHPQKMKKDFKTEQREIPSLYDIAGSANWFNKPDIGITFYRNYQSGLNEIHIQKMKYTHLGNQALVKVRYNNYNSRFTNMTGNWDNTNWLIPKSEQQTIVLPPEPKRLKEVEKEIEFSTISGDEDPF